MNNLTILAILYLPIIFFIIAIVYILTLKKLPGTGVPVNLGIFSFNIPIKNVKLVKSFLFGVTLVGTFAYYLFALDLTWFYQKKMDITVHYNDEAGILELIEEIGIKKIGNMPLVETDSISRIKYFIDGDTIITKYLDYDHYYADAVINRKQKLVTSGGAHFVVKKIRGIHTYQIVECSGELEHKRYLKNGTQKLRSTFNHVKSPYDKVRVTKANQLFKKVITPEFTQSLIIDGSVEEMLDHTLFGVTALYSFPFPSHSNTLYLYELDKKLIPIGYAVYY